MSNVFADLNMANPSELLVKAELVRSLNEIIVKRGLTHSDAAKRLGLPPLRLNDLLRGKLSDYPIDRLYQFLITLKQ